MDVSTTGDCAYNNVNGKARRYAVRSREVLLFSDVTAIVACEEVREHIGCQVLEDMESRTLSKATMGLGMILTLLPAHLPMERL